MESKRMKIAVISYHSSPVESVGDGCSGGMSIYLSNLYEKISRYAEVDILCRGTKIAEKIGNCNLIYINDLEIERFAEEIIGLHKQKKYDILHSHYWVSGIIANKIKKVLSCVPWVHSYHTIEVLKRVTEDKVRIEAEREIMRSCDFIISPTLEEKNWIKKSYPGVTVEVIPHGVSREDFPFRKDGSRNILFAGRIDPVKGVEKLMESLKFIKGDFTLSVAGGPSKEISYYEDIKYMASDYPVKFLGKVSHRELHKLYQDSCMLVLPSYYESFGLVALEAMSCGRPVVGFSDTNLSEVVGKRAGVFTNRNDRDLPRAINFLLNNTSKRYCFGREARKRASVYSWNETSRRYIEIYGKIIKEYTCNNGPSR
jgi:D-inositol-3-phosphate glycosyltransferase